MRYFLRCLLPLITAVSFSLPAAAAPQILLSVAAENHIPMRCDTHTCDAEIGTICLQPDRSDPAQGTPYMLLDPKALDVIAEGPAGQPVRIAFPQGLRIAAARGHTAIRVTIPRARLVNGGLAHPALRPKGNAIFVPQPVDGDDTPQSDADIALARTALRTIAARIVTQQAERSLATTVISRAINSLPRGRAPTLSEHAIAESQLRTATLPETASRLVREAIDHCRGVGTTFIDEEPMFSYRGCLAVNHDSMLEEIFIDYRAVLRSAPRS